MSRDDLIRVLGPEEPEIGCEECFERLDEYVDAELAGRDADARGARDARAPRRVPRLS